MRAGLIVGVLSGVAACGTTHALVDGGPGDGGNVNDGGSISSPGIYVTNGNGTITVFALDASGDAAPLRTIGGPTTGLALPIGIAVGHHDDLYIANRTGGTITVYPTTADGDVAPARTLTATGMGSPEDVALAPDDSVYASTCPSCGSANGGDLGVYHFAPGATTADRSVTGATTGLTNAGSLTIAASGDIFVGNSFGGTVERFAAAATGDVAPVSSFTPAGGINLQSIAHGASTIALTAPGHGIDFYDLGATGTPQPAGAIAASELPLSYPGGLFIDTTATPTTIYLVDYGGSAVHVITTAGSEPNLTVASVRTIQGATTKLSSPLHVAVIR